MIELTGETQTVTDLDRVLVLADEVIRHKVIRLPDKVAGRSNGNEAPEAADELGRLSRSAHTKEVTMPTDNTVVLVGNVTRDPELRFTNTGQATATFGLAVNRRWQNRQTQEWEEATCFFDVVCWREMAENVSESLARGSRVIVTGRLEQRSWETHDGDRRSKVEVVADEVGPVAALGHRPGDQERAARARRRRPGWPRRRPPRRRGAASHRILPRRGALLTWREDNLRNTSTRRVVEGRRPPGQEEAVRAVQGPHRVGRLQGRLDAPEVHERPGQDPVAAGDGQLRAAPAGHRARDQDRPRAGPACPTRSAR